MTASRPPLLTDWSRSGHPFCEAIFLERPHRFAVRAYLPDHDLEVDAHLGDPGRLHHLLQPGVRLLLDGPFPPGTRKTSYTAALVEASSGVWVSLISTLPNRLFVPLLEQGHLPALWSPPAPLPLLQREVQHGASRFDFVLQADASAPKIWVETKSVTWAAGDTGRFPDAPTQRGTKHLRELIAMQRESTSTHLVFVVQRSDVRRLIAARDIDPRFADTLHQAHLAGVSIHAVSVDLQPERVHFAQRVPLLWSDTKAVEAGS